MEQEILRLKSGESAENCAPTERSQEKFFFQNTQLKEIMGTFLTNISFHKIPANVLMREIYPLNVVPANIIMNA